MEMTTKIDNAKFRTLLKALREEIEMALGAVLDNNTDVLADGDGLKLGKCSFDPVAHSFTFTLEGKLKGGKTAEEVRYGHIAKVLAIPSRDYSDHNIPMDDAPLIPGITLPPLGAAFSYRGVRYIVKGANTTGTKIHCATLDGKVYLFKPKDVAAFWSREMKNAETPAPGRTRPGAAT